jgi:nicotinamidase-related amidase
MRSELLLDRAGSALLVIDIQERLLPAILEKDQVVARCRLLLEAARALGIPTLATVQYVKGLGPLIAGVAEMCPTPIEKNAFSACGVEALTVDLGKSGARQVVLCGIEAHVCVLQTALDLLAQGYATYVAADAVGSRRAIDRDWALGRMAQAGVIVTTAEAAIFEWTAEAGTPTFKEISRLIKQAEG